MIYPSADDLEGKVDSRYTLVVLAAKRAKQLREGAPKLIDTPSTNALTIALEEIAAGKVTYQVPSHDEVPGITVESLAAAAAMPALESAHAEAAEITAEPTPVDEAARVAELLRLPGEPVEEAVEQEAAPTKREISELLAIPTAAEETEDTPVEEAAEEPQAEAEKTDEE
jgi:DNA-directed RNA polymerase subunit omega